ncbi:hypothetical protein HDU85_003976 [Gaertneriomyces sp. JEL0708]|nr:hypothetical protein HDU85_003976 [Gaertneriomyces sp. JEL0708]
MVHKWAFSFSSVGPSDHYAKERMKRPVSTPNLRVHEQHLHGKHLDKPLPVPMGLSDASTHASRTCQGDADKPASHYAHTMTLPRSHGQALYASASDVQVLKYLEKMVVMIEHRSKRIGVLLDLDEQDGWPGKMIGEVVKAYQELVCDCWGIVGLVGERFLEDRKTEGGQGAGTMASTVRHHAFPGARQLALVQAVTTLKDALNRLGASIRRMTAAKDGGRLADREKESVQDDLNLVVDSAKAVVEVATKFVVPSAAAPKKANKRASIGSLFGRVQTDREGEKRKSGMMSLRRKESLAFRETSEQQSVNASVPLPNGHSKKSRPSVAGVFSTSNTLPRSMSGANKEGEHPLVHQLHQLVTLLTTNLHELTTLKSNLPPSSLSDLHILEQYYRKSLGTVSPLAQHLATELSSLTNRCQDLESHNRDLDRMNKSLRSRCEEFSDMNSALVQENSMLKKELQVRRFGNEGPPTPDTPERETALKTPDREHSRPCLPMGDEIRISVQMPTTPSCTTPPELNYTEIITTPTTETAPKPIETMSRLHTDIHQTQKLLDDVEKRRSVNVSTLDRGKLSAALDGAGSNGGSDTLKRQSALSLLPPIESSRPLWHDLHPPTQAAVTIQKYWRGCVQRRRYKNVRRRLMIVNEILDTEASYVRALLCLHKEYMLPLSPPESPLTPSEYQTLFAHIPEILTLHRHLLSSLVSHVLSYNPTTRLSPIFLSLSSSLRIYAPFINNYPSALALLHANAGLQKALVQIRQNLPPRSPVLEDLLITPVQRVGRYILLLKELHKYTEMSHPDYEGLKGAVEALERRGRWINERKRGGEVVKGVLGRVVGVNVESGGRWGLEWARGWEVGGGEREGLSVIPSKSGERTSVMLSAQQALGILTDAIGSHLHPYHTHTGSGSSTTSTSTSSSGGSVAGLQQTPVELLLFNDLLACFTVIPSSTTPSIDATMGPHLSFTWAIPLLDITGITAQSTHTVVLKWKGSNEESGTKMIRLASTEERDKWVERLNETRTSLLPSNASTSSRSSGGGGAAASGSSAISAASGPDGRKQRTKTVNDHGVRGVGIIQPTLSRQPQTRGADESERKKRVEGLRAMLEEERRVLEGMKVLVRMKGQKGLEGVVEEGERRCKELEGLLRDEGEMNVV